MRTHIDWLTFTFTPAWASVDTEDYAGALQYGMHDLLGAKCVETAFTGKWEPKEKSRAPYTHAWSLTDAGITLYASLNLNHACIEISGQGCERLIAQNTMSLVLQSCAERVTRIDIASDIQTVTTPTTFVSMVNHERMRASGYQKSETGETCYVGSQKSDRYARVYRYADPHPRSHLLRIEHVFRRDYAKQVAQKCVSNDLMEVAAAAGSAFGWNHPVWNVGDSSSVHLASVRPENGKGNTVYWLVNTAASAFKRLCANGTIPDPEKFIRDYFLSDV